MMFISKLMKIHPLVDRTRRMKDIGEKVKKTVEDEGRKQSGCFLCLLQSCLESTTPQETDYNLMT